MQRSPRRYVTAESPRSGRRCRTASNSRMPVATDTFRLAYAARASASTPVDRRSCASVRAVLCLRRRARARSAAADRPHSKSPARRRPRRPPKHLAAFSHSSRRTRLLTCTMNSDSAAPLAALRATSLSGALRRFGSSTAPTPAASALRRHAPRLRGSITPSSASSNNGCGNVGQPQFQFGLRTELARARSRPRRPDGGVVRHPVELRARDRFRSGRFAARGEFENRLDPRVAAIGLHEQSLDALGIGAQQRFDGVNAENAFASRTAPPCACLRFAGQQQVDLARLDVDVAEYRRQSGRRV